MSTKLLSDSTSCRGKKKQVEINVCSLCYYWFHLFVSFVLHRSVQKWSALDNVVDNNSGAMTQLFDTFDDVMSFALLFFRSGRARKKYKA